MSKNLKRQAQRLHTHTVVFTDDTDVECAIRALMGQTTQAIASATGLSEAQVGYRVRKAGIDRWEFRHGRSQLAKRVLDLGRDSALNEVETKIQPKFEKLRAK